MMRKSTYFLLYLLSKKQSDPSVSSHIVLGDDRGDKDLKLASVPRGYQKYLRGILLKAPLIQHLASNLKPKSNISPKSLQSEFLPDQSFRNWESLKDSLIYYSLNYRSIILGGSCQHMMRFRSCSSLSRSPASSRKMMRREESLPIRRAYSSRPPSVK